LFQSASTIQIQIIVLGLEQNRYDINKTNACRITGHSTHFQVGGDNPKLEGGVLLN